MLDFIMAAPGTEKERMDQWVKNWRIVGEESERLNAEKLLTLTEEEAAEQFNGLDCDPSLVWKPEERLISSGLIEQQRLFSQAHEPGLHRRA